MSHKTLIGGTAYEISGGKTMIGGTAYKISGGKTLIGGTAYDISFGTLCAVTVVAKSTNYIDSISIVTSDGQTLAYGNSYELPVGTEITITVTPPTTYGAYIGVNGTLMVSNEKNAVTYVYTLTGPIRIECNGYTYSTHAGTAEVNIVEL